MPPGSTLNQLLMRSQTALISVYGCIGHAPSSTRVRNKWILCFSVHTAVQGVLERIDFGMGASKAILEDVGRLFAMNIDSSFVRTLTDTNFSQAPGFHLLNEAMEDGWNCARYNFSVGSFALEDELQVYAKHWRKKALDRTEMQPLVRSYPLWDRVTLWQVSRGAPASASFTLPFPSL